MPQMADVEFQGLQHWLHGDRESTAFERQGIKVRMGSKTDIPALVAINAHSIAALGGEGLFMPMSEAFFLKVIPARLSFVLERDRQLLGYSIAVPADSSQPVFWDTERRKIGLLFGTALDQELWHQGWQKWLVNLRLRAFEVLGFDEVQCTVSPFNLPSLLNLIESEFQIIGLKSLLDGHPRFIVRHRFGTYRDAPPRNLQWQQQELANDLAPHAELLRRGYVGASIQRREPVMIAYSKPKDDPK